MSTPALKRTFVAGFLTGFLVHALTPATGIVATLAWSAAAGVLVNLAALAISASRQRGGRP